MKQKQGNFQFSYFISFCSLYFSVTIPFLLCYNLNNSNIPEFNDANKDFHFFWKEGERITKEILASAPTTTHIRDESDSKRNIQLLINNFPVAYAKTKVIQIHPR